MDTTDLLRARQSGPWSRVKLLDDGKMSYSMEGPPSLDIGRMTLEYCLTSPVIDREGDLILPDAPDWTDHERNPLTLFNHKLDQPFGKSQDTAGRYTVERRGDRWYGKSYLFQNDPFAEEVYRLAEKGALNGASIGFLPAKPPFGQSSVKKMNGYDYTVIERCKVFEWSAVYIPMNQDALLVAAEVVRKGLGNKPLSQRAMAMFSPFVPDAPVWANGWRAKGPGWEESAHPRGDDGQFISGGDISAAAGDKDKEAELRKRVTDPKQIQRLNVALTTEPNKSSGDFGDKYNKLEGDKLGQGSTGDVYRVGNTAVKKASKAESQVYKEMSNVDGIAHGVTHGDQIVTPYFKNIISIDAIKDKDRKGMAPIIAKAYPTLVNALTHLSEVGYDYNDDLQVGFDEKRNPNIFDFSITAKTGPVEATRENLDRLSSYLKTFGCEKLANNVSTVSIIRSAMGDLDNTLMEDDEEYKFAAKLASQLDGKEAKYFYYSSNGRTIPNAAQTEQVKGIKVIASDKPLSSKFMTDWEITPVIHKYGNGEKSFRRSTTKAAGWNESDHPRAEDGKFGSGGGSGNGNGKADNTSGDKKQTPKASKMSDENKQIVPELAQKWRDGTEASGYRIQATGKPMPSKSADMWTDDGERRDEPKEMPGTSSYAGLENALRDLVLQERESVTGENYSKNIRDDGHEPELLILFGKQVDAPGAETVVKDAKVAARFTYEDVESAFREAIAPHVDKGDEKLALEDLLDNYQFSSDELKDVESILRRMAEDGGRGAKKMPNAPSPDFNMVTKTGGSSMAKKLKMYDDNTDDQTQPPVDPIEAKADDQSPATPLGAQLIAGAHEIAMGLAKFYTDNVAQLEPELIQEFSKLEKTIMGSIAAMAQMFNGRYGDLPPLDGADWVDPDMDGDIDLTEDPVLNPDAEEDKAMAEGIQEDVIDGEDVTVDADDAAEDEVDATEDDEVEEEEEEVKPRFKKSFEEAAKRSLKALLEGWQAKQKALKDAAKRIEHPDAVVAVKAAAQFLRTMAGDPREDKVLRGRAKKLRSDLLNALPKVKAKSVVEIAPVALDIDLDKIADHFNSARKAMEVDAQAIQDKINKLFQLTGR